MSAAQEALIATLLSVVHYDVRTAAAKDLQTILEMERAKTSRSETGTLDMSEKARLKDAEDDVLRLHGEKMKFFERTIVLERELAAMTRDRDARAREACTAEGRTGCSFALSATAKSSDPFIVWEVSSRTTRVLFSTKEAADKFISSFPASVSGGMNLQEVGVI